MQRFAYHRSLSPALGVLLGLAIVETMVVHIVAVALWGWTVAIVLGLLDLSLVVAVIGLLGAIRRHPVTLDDTTLTMRVGRLKVVPIPLAAIAGLRKDWDAARLKQPGAVNLALANWPNVAVDLAEPVRMGRRHVTLVAHKLDDSQAFAAALSARLEERSPSQPGV